MHAVRVQRKHSSPRLNVPRATHNLRFVSDIVPVEVPTSQLSEFSHVFHDASQVAYNSPSRLLFDYPLAITRNASAT